MKMRDVVTISFQDLPQDSMTCAGEILRRSGLDAMDSKGFVSGTAVFAEADVNAAALSEKVADADLQFVLVLDGDRLIGLIDAEALKLIRARPASLTG